MSYNIDWSTTTGKATIDQEWLASGDIQYRQCGKTVQVSLDSMKFKKTASGTQFIATGLPPAFQYVIFSISGGTQDRPMIRLAIGDDGVLRLHHTAVDIDKLYVGSITYIAA